ncbi:Imm42 family immunity protein [Methylibium rhizosphaerae]|uniref:Imm42 family immunity protein n=1 Tax=Methylibium rhizosphaerae TaxID=2570323 RepID=UPI0015E3941E|nr:Imm42 family immunity protein [Methylibium rhizosphaerae]
MRFGDPTAFAIECIHEPIPNSNRWVFGRMCIWAGGEQLGNIDEPACMLNVTARHLTGVLKRLPELDEPAFSELSDAVLYDLLDHALYVDDGRTPVQVASDATRYFKFDFLTNGGESFDRSRSFIASSNGQVRLLFSEPPRGLVASRVDAVAFATAVTEFLAWLESEGNNGG